MSQNTRYIGTIIREHRKRQRMTGEELGQRTGLSQSKISKIETGYYADLPIDDVKNILNILNVPSTITHHIMRLLEEETTGALLPNWLDAIFSQQSTGLERRSKLICIYASNIVPAILQTIEFRTAMLRHYDMDDKKVEANLKETMRRQDWLWDGERQYHIILPQAALYTFVTSKAVLLGQLDRLERMTAVPKVRIGIMPVEAGLTFVENSSFALYDDNTLVQALARTEILSENKDDIAMHKTIFTAFEQLAYYNADAVKLIRDASTYLT